MPAREHYDQAEGQAQASAVNLLSFIGQSKSITGGWVGFACKSLIVSTSSATVFGLASWMLFHGPAGPALSFLGGSAIGFVGGLVSRWRTDVKEALLLSEKFPLLMEHHIKINEAGGELDRQSFAHWAADLRCNPRKQGIAIAAMYSAAPALDRIRQEQEEALVAAYASREAAAAAAEAELD